jgi:dTDP-4-dehydrorhamnose 3,5-epimerase
MEFERTPITGLLVIKPRVFADDRGFFFESFNQQRFDEAAGEHVAFVQDNHSRSSAGVLRGLHYQLAPHAQGKLVRVSRGRVWDVAVDLRKSSRTFGQWFGLELSAENQVQFWIPPGFAHGFVALENDSDFLYKTTAFYDKASERSIVWNDAELAIAWPQLGEPRLSEKDAVASSFKRADCFD